MKINVIFKFGKWFLRIGNTEHWMELDELDYDVGNQFLDQDVERELTKRCININPVVTMQT